VEGTAAYIYKLASASILLRLDLYLIEQECSLGAGAHSGGHLVSGHALRR